MIFKLGDIMKYKTKQKEIIINIIKSINHEFTIKDIYNSLNNKVGLTTIYRVIDNLVNENYVNKRIDKNNITYYEYLERCDNENHFFLKCNNCGNLTHVDCDCINDLYKHINKNHKFKLNKENIIINGICNKCSERK